MAQLARLKKRSQFLLVAGKGRKWATPGLVLQALRASRDVNEPTTTRVGFTASRKVGIAVVRNRARRRLREAARRVLAAHAAPGDYVMIARGETASRDFALLLGDVEAALKRLGVWRDATPPSGGATP
jgi:ribonuclease P protein component